MNAARGVSGVSVNATSNEHSATLGRCQASIDFVENEDPPVINTAVGTTVSYASIDDPRLLPEPTTGRFVATPDGWQHVLTGEAYTADEIVTWLVETLREYHDQFP